MTAIAPGKKASDELVKTTEEIFTALGKAAVVTERQLDELGALSGAGPGYAFVIIDALADAGVLVGLPRKLAIEAAAQTPTAQPRWSLRQENIRPNSAIRSQARAERRSPVSMSWKREASGPL